MRLQKEIESGGRLPNVDEEMKKTVAKLHTKILIGLLLLASPVVPLQAQQAESKSQSAAPQTWWKNEVQVRLDEAGENSDELRTALQQVKYEHRRALEFLIEHMPSSDLKVLKADYLLNNIDLAYQAINQVPWGKQISEDIFFNDILPYANVDETREDWRGEMMKRCLPLVAECKTPGEAALKLNRELFPLIDVRYSRKRKKANQSPSESMELSCASCTGLSIILIDACRSVGVPSRLAGIPSWTNKRGNHTWVEVWDNDDWHFTGAAEPADQLNQAWFQNDASLANNDEARHRIYAVSYARTGLHFPMVWAPRSRQANAINVTERYTGKPAKAAESETQTLISIFSADGNRIKREVTVTFATEETALNGTTRDESADLNDMLMLVLPRDQKFTVTWNEEDGPRSFERSTADAEQTSWEFRLQGKK